MCFTDHSLVTFSLLSVVLVFTIALMLMQDWLSEQHNLRPVQSVRRLPGPQPVHLPRPVQPTPSPAVGGGGQMPDETVPKY